MKYKLIALDLDGTLKNSQNKTTPKTIQTLIQAQELGIKIVLASGRPTPGLRYEAKELQLDKYDGYLLSFNGARVSSVKTNQTIYEQTLSSDDAKSIYEHAKKFDLTCLIYEGDCILSENVDDKYVKAETFINDMKLIKVDCLKDYMNKPLQKYC